MSKNNSSKQYHLNKTEPYPPILLSPDPPGHALTKPGSASRATGLKVPVLKYGPTGDRITNIRAWFDRFTPKDGWVGTKDIELDTQEYPMQRRSADL